MPYLERIHAADVAQRKVPELPKVLKGKLLQVQNRRVMALCHVIVGQRLARVVIDFKADVKLQHIEELGKQMAPGHAHELRHSTVCHEARSVDDGVQVATGCQEGLRRRVGESK